MLEVLDQRWETGEKERGENLLNPLKLSECVSSSPLTGSLPSSVDDAVTLYNATLTHIIDTVAPLTKRTIKKDQNCPWYTLELRVLDDAVTLYNATLTHIIDTVAPLTKRTIKKDQNCPWYTLELRVPHRSPATPEVWLGACKLACKLPRAALSSDAVALGGCMAILQCVKKWADNGTRFEGQCVFVFAPPEPAQGW
ncbi:UNVERIFIED_CONTAM: hypothetical protein FKN15_051041 [Acipenser sinensis]